MTLLKIQIKNYEAKKMTQIEVAQLSLALTMSNN